MHVWWKLRGFLKCQYVLSHFDSLIYSKNYIVVQKIWSGCYLSINGVGVCFLILSKWTPLWISNYQIVSFELLCYKISIYRCYNTTVIDSVPKHCLWIHAQHIWCCTFDKYESIRIWMLHYSDSFQVWIKNAIKSGILWMSDLSEFNLFCLIGI